MRLIVGLGNPDPEYQWTPYNLGFMAVDELANRGGIRVERPEGQALVGRGKIAGEEVILAKPQTYMNLSGISVRELLGKYELEVRDLLALWDEAQLPLGTIRVHPGGSAGSHNGAKSVISAVGMEERYYDLVFIVRPATPEEEIKKVLTVIEHTVVEKGGKIEKTEHWGTRKLAYRVAKHREGIYVHQEIRTNHGELIAELERRLRVQDNVIKYQTVRLDEDLKRQKKLSQKREKRAARRPRRTPAPAPAAAAPEQAAASS